MFNRVFDYVVRLFAVVAGVILVLMTASVNYEVFMRYFFNRPTTWVVDYSQYSLVIITMLATAWVLTREGHVKIELIVGALSPKVQQVLNTITSALGVLVCGIFFWYSLQVTLDAFSLKQVFIHHECEVI